MKTKRFLIVLAILLISLALASGAMAGFWQSNSMPDPLTSEPLPEGDELWVVRIYYDNQEQLIELTSMFAPWEVHPDRGYLVVDVDRLEYSRLLGSGYRLEVDEKQTEQLNKPNEPLPGQVSGIPGYPCYRTVEETYATAEQIVADYPHLAAWIDIGDSWEKITPGGEPGYDIMLLRLTNENMVGVKAKIFIMAAVHAREYTTAELATRFAEYLVENYDTDPEVTWILDHNEVHLVLQANPDGRKKAEAGLSWRKNTNNNYCTDTNSRGADLNRNFPFLWGGTGGSSNPCSDLYRGPWAASEPETQAIINYVRDNFPDQRDDDENAPAPDDAMGIFLDLHSYSQLILWPWGHVYNPAPNGTALQTLGRKFAYFNNYTPQQSVYLYPTTGTTDDFGYGELGLASYTFELGNSFFESCSAFENTIFPNNMPALLYAATATRLPYMEPAGPDPLDVVVYPSGAAPGDVVRISAVLDDTRFNNSEGTEPVQNIVEAEYYINVPPWEEGAVAFPMTPVDGSFNSPVEAVEAYLETSGFEQGRYMVFVRGKDAANNWGVVSADFLYILDPESAPVIQGYVRSAADNSPLEATVRAGPFLAMTNPDTGFYSMQVISGEYTLLADAPDHAPTSIPGIEASDYDIINQNIYLDPVCTVFFDDVESGNQGWTAQAPWAITTEAYHSPTHSWTDSPGGPYSNNRNISLTSQAFNLSGMSGITLDFWHRYDIETGWDYGYVEYSTNGGATWSTAASYTGNGQTTWREENISLPALDGISNARIRFRFFSDGWITADGWHIDDIHIKAGGDSCIVPLPPEAAFISSSPVMLGEAVHFTDLTYGTPPFEFEWDFGDGIGFSTDSDPSYTYLQPGIYTVTMTVINDLGTSTADGQVSVLGDFVIDPLFSEGWADPGETVTYDLSLTNMSDESYTFLLSLGEHNWESWISIDEAVVLQPGEAVEFSLFVTIPVDIDGGSLEVLELLVSILDYPEIQITAQVTTHANVLVGLIIDAPETEGEGFPGSIVEYNLSLTNIGNAAANFLMDVESLWETEVRNQDGEIIGPEDEISIGRNESVSLTLSVAVPPDATVGDQDVTSLTFTFQGDIGYTSDPVLFTTTAIQQCISLSSVNLQQLTTGFIRPGNEVAYQADFEPDNATYPFSYSIFFGDGSDPLIGHSNDNPMPFNHTFQEPGLYDVEIEVTNCSMIDPVSDSLVTAVIFEGLELEPLLSEAWGDPGSTIVYILTLTNTSEILQNFLLQLGEHSWETLISIEDLELPAGEAEVFEISVTIPEDVDGASWEAVELMVSLADDPSMSITAQVKTTANILVGLEIETSGNESQTYPGKSVLYPMTLINTGNIQGDFLLEMESEWLLEVLNSDGEIIGPDDEINLLRGESATLFARVSIPEGTAHGVQDEASVWFILQGEPSFLSEPVVFTTQSIHYQLYMPFLSR